MLQHRDIEHVKSNHMFVNKSENQLVLKTEYLDVEALA